MSRFDRRQNATVVLSGRPRTSWGLSQFSSDENGTVPLAKVEVVAGRPLRLRLGSDHGKGEHGRPLSGRHRRRRVPAAGRYSRGRLAQARLHVNRLVDGDA